MAVTQKAKNKGCLLMSLLLCVLLAPGHRGKGQRMHNDLDDSAHFFQPNCATRLQIVNPRMQFKWRPTSLVLNLDGVSGHSDVGVLDTARDMKLLAN